jgi:MFS family permease
MALPSHLVMGWLADRLHKPRLMGLSMLVATGGLVLMINGDDEWRLWVFTALFTLVESIFPVTWATVGDYFGRKSFGTIRGAMSFFYMWGAVLPPVIAGAIYDHTRSYQPMLWGLVVVFLLSALLYELLVRPSAHDR